MKRAFQGLAAGWLAAMAIGSQSACGPADSAEPPGADAAIDSQDAAALQERLAAGRVLSRIFPYSDRWLRLGLPGPRDWHRLEAALA